MKTFKKLALVTAIAAAPFAAQAMEALDDSVLGNTTGQAGVTIEIDIAAGGISIGEVEYNDTAGGAIGGGSVLLQNIAISEADITQTIDVAADGSLVLGVSKIDNLILSMGNFDGTNPDASAVALKGSNGTTEVVNGLKMDVSMGASSTTLVNLADIGGAGNTSMSTAYGLDGVSFDNGVDTASFANAGSLAIKMSQNVLINDLDVQLFGYTQAQADIKTNVAGAQTTLDTNTGTLNGLTGLTNVTYLVDGTVDQVDVGSGLVAKNDGSVTAVAGATAAIGDVDLAAGTLTATKGVSTAVAGASAIQINDVKFYNGVDTVGVTVNQTIWAQGGSIADGGGVYIAMGDMQGTLEIGGIVMGGTNSIGSIKISDMNLSGMTQRIYGH